MVKIKAPRWAPFVYQKNTNEKEQVYLIFVGEDKIRISDFFKEDKNSVNKNGNKKSRKNNKINLAIITILVILNILINFINLPDTINYLLISGTVIYLIIQLVIYLKNKNILKKSKYIKK